MDDVRSELDRLIRKKRTGYAAISRMLGRNQSYIQQFIKRGSPRYLEEEDVRKLARFFGVSEHVLGAPTRDTDDLVEIPCLDLEVSAGFRALASGENTEATFGFDKRWLRRLTGAKADKLSIVRVAGDSMEPTLSAGDEVLVDASDQALRLSDGIFVLRADDSLIIKRVAVTPGSSLVTVLSDNPAYPSWKDLDRMAVHVVGRVIWLGRPI